ncbi:TrkA-C domain protein [Pyrolobus fumarii 1A]|uniref:TrkA-C domain protein n=1 Tax=Pyrolobus fumarii (strain DSM 11204 / 1A) TaxID=694429 RepID=G0EFF5_PYRF1|nr:TrkA C-terminal domain-containing protein [Pyrolobus fumarii]AEM38979.1 TrkA-C domain protein [Pyrolobus fumarii 1A]
MSRYRPVPLTRLLRDMMSYASTALDLGFYAIAFRDEGASYEVVQLERLVEKLWEGAVVEASLAVRGYEEAVAMVSVFKVVDGLVRVTDVAADLASLVLRGIDPPSLLRVALLSGAEVTAPLRVRSKMRVAEIEDEGVDIVAVRRGGEWIIHPSDDVMLEPGDVVVVRGSPENVARVTGMRFEVSSGGGEVEEETLRLKKLADILLDLGFYSILYGDEIVALHVQEIEHRLDEEIIYYYEMVSGLGLSPQQEYALHKFAEVVENVSDVAAAMASMVRTHRPIHRVIAAAEDMSQERILALVYQGPGGVRLGDTGLQREEVIVVAVRRGERWVPTPPPTVILEPGDRVIIKTYVEDLDELLESVESMGFRVLREKLEIEE